MDIQTTISKADRLIYGESAMSHAMVFTGLATDVSYLNTKQKTSNSIFFFNKKQNGELSKFRVENSWGEDRGEKGYLIMTKDWFKEFMFEVVVDKKYVPESVLEVFKQEPIVLPAWDPMGTLAL